MHTSRPAGFEPTRVVPIGFQVQRLNHSAKVAVHDVQKSPPRFELGSQDSESCVLTTTLRRPSVRTHAGLLPCYRVTRGQKGLTKVGFEPTPFRTGMIRLECVLQFGGKTPYSCALDRSAIWSNMLPWHVPVAYARVNKKYNNASGI